MARGIITKKPVGGSSAGKIMTTDPATSGTVSGGGADAADPTVISVQLGQMVDYTEVCSSEEGDVVEFAYDGRQASSITTQGKATVITGTYQPDITISQGETVLLNAATLNGVLITINGGCLTVINNTIIKGRIVSTVDGSCAVISTGTEMNGNFQFTGASSFAMRNTTTQGSIESNGNTYVSVRGCTIKGKLEVLNAASCNCSGNTVSGGTNTPGCTA